MRLIKLLAPLLWTVATNGQSRCGLEEACVAGLTSVELDICEFTDDDVDDLAACFNTIGRSNIEYLNLRRNDLANLPLGFFDGFDALAELNLEFNELNLQAGTFQGATSLDSLNLARNTFDFLPNRFFQGLESLRELNLFSNGMTLAAGDFVNATSLEVLIFNSTGSESLPSGVFEGLDTLLELKISSNRFTTLPADIFDDVPNLISLDFADNRIETLPAGIFANLANLRKLKTSRNSFDTWPANLLEGLTSLTTLDLNGHQLTTLEAGTFDGTPALEFLDLSSNSFSTLPAGTFDGIDGSLIELDLRFNDFTELPADIFNDFPSLRILDLGSNDLILEADDFAGATSLEELDLSAAISNDLPAGVFDGLTSLRTLDLSFNGQILLLADHFKGATSLEMLSLGGNRLTTLPTGVFDDLVSLTSLSLASNNLINLEDGTFQGTPALEMLALAFNELPSLSANIFDGLAALQELDLGFNAISTLPAGTFDGLAALLSLDLDDNRLTAISAELFNGAPSLEDLTLSDNDLSTLPAEIFQGTPALRSLAIEDNMLMTLATGTFDNLVSLQDLDLRKNDLSTLPAGLFDGLETLQELDLDDNDDLQCLPATNAQEVGLPDTFDEASTCGCPEDPVCDEDGTVCECQPGINGYSCAGSSSELLKAFSCPSVDTCSSDDECAGDEVCCTTSQTCEPLLGGSSSACGDPHMTGFHGQKFDFTGEDGAWYALISDLPALHLNMRVTAPVPGVPEITYITGVSLITVGADDTEHSIVISVNNPHSLDSACPVGMHTCLADGALSIAVNGENALVAPGTASPGAGVGISAVNLPGACRSFGFEKYWERKMLEQVRVGQEHSYESQDTDLLMADAPVASATQDMSEWIMGDPTATNMMECAAYVEKSLNTDGGLFAYQSEHASFKISTPTATIRLSHGRLHQVAMRDPTDTFDLPDHLTWQMNLAVDLHDINRDATGVLGETFVPTVDARGNIIMNGMEAIRGTQESYRVAGPFDVGFVASTNRT